MSVKGRIKPGTMCGLDFSFFRWPDIPDSHRREGFHSGMVFNIEDEGNGRLCCWTDGFGGSVYGRQGKYGNGSITVFPDSKSEQKGQP